MHRAERDRCRSKLGDDAHQSRTNHRTALITRAKDTGNHHSVIALTVHRGDYARLQEGQSKVAGRQEEVVVVEWYKTYGEGGGTTTGWDWSPNRELERYMNEIETMMEIRNKNGLAKRSGGNCRPAEADKVVRRERGVM
ncbi:hypothetical protein M407DRAFT_12019 [Tulasnella calospora MUT 4182]|uniref:Uncharacterized protein n=1 Tax=Tulasnella calospora MUT 4182 TaxID=1051891 RepID=A0A0C3Q4F5_9AGAM|nr:hypothetical protein M407DRAFT_12019 [Tulasnella calospora MUT 4182]